MMARPKDAKRRSLNMPSTHEGQKEGQVRASEEIQQYQQQQAKPQPQQQQKPQQQAPPKRDRSADRRARNGAPAPRAPNGGYGDVQFASSRSDSPNAAYSVPPAQSKLPVSPTSPTFNNLPQYPPSPERTKGNQTRSFFQNLKASRSATKIPREDTTIRPVQYDTSPSEETPRGPQRTTSTPDMHEASSPEPVPDMPRLDDSSQGSCSGYSHAIPRRPVGSFASQQSQPGQLPRPQTTPGPGGSEQMTQTSMSTPDIGDGRKSGGRLLTSFMRRNHHNRSQDHTNIHTHTHPGSKDRSRSRPNESAGEGKPPSRDQSATRSDMEDPMDRPNSKSHMKGDGAGSQLFRAFQHQAGRAAKEIGKSRGRFFRSRHSSNTQPPPDFSNYKLQVINLDLVKQTRITRIAKRLEDSKDKTEFWMPALPWRCIDYLNFNGAEVEGLYRVPGSEREVRMWKARFDQEYDIDLFKEEELYDVNVIGSLFKSWLRELPEPILSKDIQAELTAKYAGEQETPKEVKDKLSKLPPWNYYLLFAITCHLSLLHAYRDTNKMNFHNLQVCFAASLNLNPDCFRWLVGDWRSCWIGCETEKEALEQEYREMEMEAPELVPEPAPPFIQDTYNSTSRKGSSAGQSMDETPRAEAFGSPRPQGSSHSHSSKMQGNGQASAGKPQGRRKAGESPHSRETSRSGLGREHFQSPSVKADSPRQQPQEFALNQPQQSGQLVQQQQQQQQSPPPPPPTQPQQQYQQTQQKQYKQQLADQSQDSYPKYQQQHQQQQEQHQHQRVNTQKLPELDFPRPMSSDWMNK